MRILPLILVLVAAPAALSAQEGARRGAPVPARALREAAAVRPTSPKEPSGARASRAPDAWTVPARPPKRRSGS